MLVPTALAIIILNHRQHEHADDALMQKIITSPPDTQTHLLLLSALS